MIRAHGAFLHTSVAPVDKLFTPHPGIAVWSNGGLCLAPRHATSSRDQDTPWGSGWPPSCMFPPILACRQETQSCLQRNLTQDSESGSESSYDTGELRLLTQDNRVRTLFFSGDSRVLLSLPALPTMAPTRDQEWNKRGLGMWGSAALQSRKDWGDN